MGSVQLIYEDKIGSELFWHSRTGNRVIHRSLNKQVLQVMNKHLHLVIMKGQKTQASSVCWASSFDDMQFEVTARWNEDSAIEALFVPKKAVQVLSFELAEDYSIRCLLGRISAENGTALNQWVSPFREHLSVYQTTEIRTLVNSIWRLGSSLALSLGGSPHVDFRFLSALDSLFIRMQEQACSSCNNKWIQISPNLLANSLVFRLNHCLRNQITPF